jgi:DNA topoisomerase-1
MCDGDFRSLKKDDDVYTVGFDRAMELLNEEKKARRGAQALREIGKLDEEKIELMDGKYGMYLKWGKVNATLPEGVEHEKLTLEQAIEIVKARAEVVGDKGGKGGKKGGSKKAAAPAKKAAAAKKAPAKKSATKNEATQDDQ